jgi:hypothetical protein
VTDNGSLSELRTAAADALRNAAEAIATTSVTPRLRSHGWGTEEASGLAVHLRGLADDVSGARPVDTINMAMTLDFSGIRLQSSDELQEAAYKASKLYNAYVRRLRGAT